ncbi:MAG: rRNA maturation RNase YbeY [Marinifilaceae bacterium]
MEILFNAEEIEMPAVDQERIRRWINRVVVLNGCETGEINYIFCSDDYLLKINREYLNHDYYTDIITFDYVQDQVISGDLFISLDTIRDNADYYKVSFDEELHRVIIHGVLHLLGIDDKTDEDQEIMTQKENESLALLSEID